MKLTASAYLRKGKVYMQAFSKTDVGVWIASGPVFVVEEGDAKTIGAKALEALNHSRQGVPHPQQSEWSAVANPMLEAAGVKSWATFARGSKAVGLDLEDGVVTLEPSSNYEKKGGTSLPEKSRVSGPVAEELGDGLLKAFADCK